MSKLIQIIGKKRQEYYKAKGKRPETIAVEYDDGVDLLCHFSEVCTDKPQREKLSLMIMKGDRDEILKQLNGMTVFGLKLTVVDVVIDVVVDVVVGDDE